MITVGIQNNIRLLEASKNDQGTLIIKMQQDNGGTGSLLDMLSSTSSQASENDQDYYFWPLKEDERLQSEMEKYKDALNKIKTFRAQLNHFLEQFMVESKIHWDPTKNLGLAEADLVAGLQDAVKRPLILGGIYNNYVDQFVAQLTPFAGSMSALFRVKFVRSSKDKHFSTVPKFAPFIEPVSIPVASSKLKYSRYELGWRKGDPDKGPYTGVNYSDPTPVEGAAATASKGNPEEAAAVDNLFGKS